MAHREYDAVRVLAAAVGRSVELVIFVLGPSCAQTRNNVALTHVMDVPVFDVMEAIFAQVSPCAKSTVSKALVMKSPVSEALTESSVAEPFCSTAKVAAPDETSATCVANFDAVMA